ncbi:complexin-3-like [Hemicordylus capensis]|uniref:complexin-3-like n=1 Tax=Hemicordylus capensis TaxID=884348 RepID=UPI00230255B3|nr:complexin-3-like [Hemicordylus capensis]
MESMVKSTFGVPAKQLLCCISAEFPKEKEPSRPTCPSKGQALQLPQKQKGKRDTAFAQRKAERAAMRVHLREKYQLPKNRTDKKQLEAARGKPKLPHDLLAIVKPKATSESGSIFSSFGDLDFGSLRTTAQNAVQSLQRPVQCPVM